MPIFIYLYMYGYILPSQLGQINNSTITIFLIKWFCASNEVWFNYYLSTITHSPTDSKFCFSSFFIRGRPGFIFKGEVGVFWAAGWMKCANSSVCFNKYSNLFARSVCWKKCENTFYQNINKNSEIKISTSPYNNLSNKKELLLHARTQMRFKSIILCERKQIWNYILYNPKF